MSSMMCREYVGNFLTIFLCDKLYTRGFELYTTLVNSFFLIMNT